MKSDRSARISVVERRMGAGDMAPLHVHPDDEVFEVLEGALTLFIGEDTARLEPGDAFVAPAGVAHTQRADTKHVRYLAGSFVRSPSRYEDFLRAVGRPVEPAESGAALDWPSPDEEAALAAIAAANAITVLGPPGALPAAAAAAA